MLHPAPLVESWRGGTARDSYLCAVILFFGRFPLTLCMFLFVFLKTFAYLCFGSFFSLLSLCFLLSFHLFLFGLFTIGCMHISGFYLCFPATSVPFLGGQLVATELDPPEVEV